MTFSARLFPPVIALLFELSATASAGAAQYVVDGIALGSRVALDSQNYRSYSCNPSDDFAELVWCQRSQQRSAKGRNIIVSNTIAHTPDRTALYLMANAAPVMLNRSIIESEIDQLTRELGEQPVKITWFPRYHRPNGPTSVIVHWG